MHQVPVGSYKERKAARKRTNKKSRNQGIKESRNQGIKKEKNKQMYRSGRNGTSKARKRTRNQGSKTVPGMSLIFPVGLFLILKYL